MEKDEIKKKYETCEAGRKGAWRNREKEEKEERVRNGGGGKFYKNGSGRGKEVRLVEREAALEKDEKRVKEGYGKG